MTLLDRLFPNRRAHELIVVWENGAKADLIKEIEAWPEEGTPVQSKKEERAMLRAFLDRVESRIVAHAVMGSVAPRVDKKEQKFLSKT